MPTLRPDTLTVMLLFVSCSHLMKNVGLLAEGDARRRPAFGLVAAVWPLVVVEAQPGLQIAIDARHEGVVAVAKGDPVVKMQDGAPRSLDEGVEVRAGRRDAMVTHTRQSARGAERSAELGPLSVPALRREQAGYHRRR